jgi:hypothetical protein
MRRRIRALPDGLDSSLEVLDKEDESLKESKVNWASVTCFPSKSLGDSLGDRSP